jgi:hypothetical protein
VKKNSEVPTLIANSGYWQNLKRNPNLERKKMKNKKFLGLKSFLRKTPLSTLKIFF